MMNKPDRIRLLKTYVDRFNQADNLLSHLEAEANANYEEEIKKAEEQKQQTLAKLRALYDDGHKSYKQAKASLESAQLEGLDKPAEFIPPKATSQTAGISELEESIRDVKQRAAAVIARVGELKDVRERNSRRRKSFIRLAILAVLVAAAFVILYTQSPPFKVYIDGMIAIYFPAAVPESPVSATERTPSSVTPIPTRTNPPLTKTRTPQPTATRPRPTMPPSLSGVVTTTLRVRAGPSAEHRVVDGIASGGRVLFDARSEDNKWLHVAGGQGVDPGWVSADYVNLDRSIEMLPVIK